MYRINRNLTILLINLCFLLLSIIAHAQELEHGQNELNCFDEDHPPPTIAGGLNIVFVDSAAATVNPHPEKKRWFDGLSQDDFIGRICLPNEIAQINPDIQSWTSILFEGWWKVGCFIKPINKKKVLITVHYFGFGSGTWFLEEQSGRIVNEMSKDLVQHEQGHFNIVELGRQRWQMRARRMNQKLLNIADKKQIKLWLADSVTNDQSSISKKASELIEQLANQNQIREILHELERSKLIDTGWAEGFSELYDLQTNYGKVSHAQKRWNNMIRDMLSGK